MASAALGPRAAVAVACRRVPPPPALQGLTWSPGRAAAGVAVPAGRLRLVSPSWTWLLPARPVTGTTRSGGHRQAEAALGGAVAPDGVATAVAVPRRLPAAVGCTLASLGPVVVIDAPFMLPVAAVTCVPLQHLLAAVAPGVGVVPARPAAAIGADVKPKRRPGGFQLLRLRLPAAARPPIIAVTPRPAALPLHAAWRTVVQDDKRGPATAPASLVGVFGCKLAPLPRVICSSRHRDDGGAGGGATVPSGRGVAALSAAAAVAGVPLVAIHARPGPATAGRLRQQGVRPPSLALARSLHAAHRRLLRLLTSPGTPAARLSVALRLLAAALATGHALPAAAAIMPAVRLGPAKLSLLPAACPRPLVTGGMLPRPAAVLPRPAAAARLIPAAWRITVTVTVGPGDRAVPRPALVLPRPAASAVGLAAGGHLPRPAAIARCRLACGLVGATCRAAAAARQLVRGVGFGPALALAALGREVPVPRRPALVLILLPAWAVAPGLLLPGSAAIRGGGAAIAVAVTAAVGAAPPALDGPAVAVAIAVAIRGGIGSCGLPPPLLLLLLLPGISGRCCVLPAAPSARAAAAVRLRARAIRGCCLRPALRGASGTAAAGILRRTNRRLRLAQHDTWVARRAWCCPCLLCWPVTVTVTCLPGALIASAATTAKRLLPTLLKRHAAGLLLRRLPGRRIWCR